IQQLSNNLLGEVMEASASAQKSVEKIFLLARQEEDALRKAALKTVTESKAAGYGAKQAKVDMEKILRSQGITSFTDKAGRKWSLSDYCNMATR
ncbi:phage minor capsid protein, partial [Klebsiella pneumoniae]|uniref:phage minor capsid protein n=1 Tax=Klebsiella pneumoniae TaxID=573 RepID=UPI00200D4F24